MKRADFETRLDSLTEKGIIAVPEFYGVISLETIEICFEGMAKDTPFCGFFVYCDDTNVIVFNQVWIANEQVLSIFNETFNNELDYLTLFLEE